MMVVKQHPRQRRFLFRVTLTVVTDAEDRDDARRKIYGWLADELWQKFPYRMKGTRITAYDVGEPVEDEEGDVKGVRD